MAILDEAEAVIDTAEVRRKADESDELWVCAGSASAAY